MSIFELRKKREPVFELQLDGTIGSFQVKSSDSSSSSIEVKYILTHASLDQKDDTSQRLLNILSPVREVFDLEALDFSEIMQRDIDDSRVSLDLIRYILDEGNSGLVKLFPPIVCVVLPVDSQGKLINTYSDVTIEHIEQDGYSQKLTQSGVVGNEMFRFEEAKLPNEVLYLKSDGAKLHLSKQNTRLAIVDGQHRAMALLALYRNLMVGGWDHPRRKQFKHFYDLWPESYIKKFELSSIQLPIMICALPQLDSKYQGSFDVIRASRKIFLTLNKNARKVSDTRNKLLDDQDLVAECLRATLSDIKNSDARSSYALRIFNIELDQDNDRQKISNKFCITGVSHIYSICEYILFYNDRLHGISSANLRLASRSVTDGAFHRLGLINELSLQTQESTKRRSYTDDISDIITKEWEQSFGTLIIRLLSEIYPYGVHTKATLEIFNNIEKTTEDKALKSIIFDGQGTAKVLGRFQEGLSQAKISDNSLNTPEIDASLLEIENLNARKVDKISKLNQLRAKLYLSSIEDNKILDKSTGSIDLTISKFINQNVIEGCTSTIAFQTALVLTFIDMIEKLYDNSLLGISEWSNKFNLKDQELTHQLLDEYIKNLNNFFKPSNFTQLKALASIFEGKLEKVESSEASCFNIVTSNESFRSVVMLDREMTPDEWPKYRYLLLKAWQTSNSELKLLVDHEIAELEQHILHNLFSKLKKELSKDLVVDESALTQEDISRCKKQSSFRLNSLLEYIQIAQAI